MQAVKRFASAIAVLGFVLGLGFGLTACGPGSGGSSSSPSASAPGSATLSLNGVLSARLQQIAAAPNAAANARALFSADQVITGELLAYRVESDTQETFAWSAYLDESTLEIQSNKTIILTPGTYDFSLLLTKGVQQYAGEALQVAIADGENTVRMTVRPIIGDTVTDVQVVQRLADFRFQYDPAELAGFAEPALGIIVDGGNETVFEINPLTGLSHDYVNLPAGPHTVRLHFYNAGLLIGRSLAAQEDVTVVPGVNLLMDLVALHGETVLSLAVAGGDALFSFSIPAEVVDEAGGVDDLEVLFSMVGPENPLQEQVLALSGPVGDAYAAEATLNGLQYGTVDLTLAFRELSTGEALGTCNVAGVTLTAEPQAVLCDLVLRRRAVISGHLLATLGVNVFDTNFAPVAGASVFADGELIGITGSGGFGTEGYLKAWLIAGSYTLEAQAGGQFGNVGVDLAPLGVHNVDIVLDGLVDADNDGVAPPEDCDDANADVYPGAPGTGEGIDNNCDGVVDGDELPPPARVIDFEGLQDTEVIAEFYNGGTGSLGSGPGTDHGVTFSDNTLALVEGGYATFSGEPSPVTIAATLTDAPIVINVPDGFTTGLGFYYVSAVQVHVGIYDGPDGTGTLLKLLDLAATPNVPLQWVQTGDSFDGTARSVVMEGWSGSISGNFAIDDLTLGSAVPGDGGGPPQGLLLDFEGLQSEEPVLEFYNGGTGGLGSGPGVNHGVSFSPQAIAAADPGGSFVTPSPPTVLYFMDPSGIVMNVPAGFDTGLSFYYASIGDIGGVALYDGPDGTGAELASVSLPPNVVSAPVTLTPVAIPFDGVAHSARFGGIPSNIIFDDVLVGGLNEGGGGPMGTPFSAPLFGAWDSVGLHYPFSPVSGKVIQPPNLIAFTVTYEVFDLTTASGVVSQATLQLPVMQYQSADPSEQLVVFDVTTDTSTLTGGGVEPNVNVFNDLIGGAQFGSAFVSSEGLLNLTLNAQAIAAINAALGGEFPLSVALLSIQPGGFTPELVAFGPATLLLTFE